MTDETVTDEIVTEVDSSDARSAEEFLFGADADDASAGVAEEEDIQQEAGEKAQQAPQGSDEAGDETAPAQELKVVVSIRGDRATIGVQRPSADPHIESFDGLDLSGLAQQVAAVAERAQARWEEEPKFPAHERPAPPARRQRQRRQEPAQASLEEGEADQQQPETLRLF